MYTIHTDSTDCRNTGVTGALLIIMFGVLSIVLFPVLIIATTLLCLLKRFSRKSTTTSTISREGHIPSMHRRNDIIELKSIRETDREGQSEDSVYDDQIGLRELAMLRFQSLSTRTGSTYV